MAKFLKSTFFRSEPMSKCELVLHKETAFECMYKLGIIGKVQLIKETDESNEEGPFDVDIERCRKMVAMIAFIEHEIEECKIPISFCPEVNTPYLPRTNELNSYEEELTAIYNELKEVNRNIKALCNEKEHNQEKYEVMVNAEKFLRGDPTAESTIAWSDSIIMDLISNESVTRPTDIKLSFIVATIPVERFYGLERLLFRSCRGNYLIKSKQFVYYGYLNNQPTNLINKVVFVVCFIGQKIRERILKICSAYRARVFKCPNSSAERNTARVRSQQKEKEIELVVQKSDKHRRDLLSFVAFDLFKKHGTVKKMLAIYEELNRMSKSPPGNYKYLSSFCWIPSSSINEVREALYDTTMYVANQKDYMNLFPPVVLVHMQSRTDVPPTNFILSELTRGFQALVNAYGLPNYQELNPTSFTIITFPFLFAVMFGDLGHGLILLIFGCILLLKNKNFEISQASKESPSEIGKIFFGGRYVILLMGIFSMYAGIIYNNIFSMAFTLFPSKWLLKNFDQTDVLYHMGQSKDVPLEYEGSPYPIGIDPIWNLSSNKMIVYNSIKMKIAIIFGVFHMIFGMVLAGVNHIYFKEYVDLLLITLPQLVFFCSLFFYLIMLMFVKWVKYSYENEPPFNAPCAPSLLLTFINMMLMKDTPKLPGCNPTMYPGQRELEYFLITLALLCIPTMLIGKPIYLIMQKKQIYRTKNTNLRERLSQKRISQARKSLVYRVKFLNSTKMQHREKNLIEKIDMQEVWIHSGIMVIDTVMGAISHTASYLRLWALSLAHEQLSEVVWDLILRNSFGKSYYYSVLIAVGFACWSVLNLGILVAMEALSAFLHTLRLHWVEFQSKFYDGNGIPFQPFRFERLTLNKR